MKGWGWGMWVTVSNPLMPFHSNKAYPWNVNVWTRKQIYVFLKLNESICLQYVIIILIFILVLIFELPDHDLSDFIFLVMDLSWELRRPGWSYYLKKAAYGNLLICLQIFFICNWIKKLLQDKCCGFFFFFNSTIGTFQGYYIVFITRFFVCLFVWLFFGFF